MKKLIVERLELAAIYAEDGAMTTTLEIVREVEELLKKEIDRRSKILSKITAKGR